MIIIGLQHYEIAQWTTIGLSGRPIGGAGYFGGKLVQNTKREIFFKIEYFKRWAHLLCAFEMLKCYCLRKPGDMAKSRNMKVVQIYSFLVW